MKAIANIGTSFYAAPHESLVSGKCNSSPYRVIWVSEAAPLAPLGDYGDIDFIPLEGMGTWIESGGTSCDAVILGASDYNTNLALCRRLHKDPAKYLIPTIVLVPDRDAAEAAIDAGASDFCLFYDAMEELPARLRLCLLNQELSQRIAWQLDDQRREINESNLLTERIVDSLPVSLYVVDRNRRIVAWNRNREVGGQGIGRQHVIGRNVYDVFSKMPRQRLEEEFDHVFETGETLRFEPVSEIDGDTRYWRMSKIPVKLADDEPNVTHVLTVGEEITEQKKMNDAILHAEKLAGIGKLASGIVHEINNPLATIGACAEALQNRLHEASKFTEEIREDFLEYLKLIHDETFRCKTITDSLLEFSGRRPAEKTALDMNYLVHQTLRLVKHHPKLRRMKLDLSLEDGLLPVDANEGQLKQVFIALITNACDAMDEETGHLQIRTRIQRVRGQILVAAEFTDNGTGIPPEIQTRIFDPFVTTKPFGQGTGLGLAVCYGIISDHGGEIGVQSRVSKGTTMTVLLPPASS